VSIADVHIRLLAAFYKVLDPALRKNSNNPPSGDQCLNIEDVKATVALRQ
jgi:hypothetical protein